MRLGPKSLNSCHFQLEFGEEDDVDAARAKLKEWVLESGYDETFVFEIEEYNEIEEFSNSSAMDEKSDAENSQQVDEATEQSETTETDKVENIVDDKIEKVEEKAIKVPEEKAEEEKEPENEKAEEKVDEPAETVEEKTSQEIEKPVSKEAMETDATEKEDNQAEDKIDEREPQSQVLDEEMPEILDHSDDSNDMFKEAGGGGEFEDVLELDYGEDDLIENKEPKTQTPEPSSSEPPEPVSGDFIF